MRASAEEPPRAARGALHLRSPVQSHPQGSPLELHVAQLGDRKLGLVLRPVQNRGEALAPAVGFHGDAGPDDLAMRPGQVLHVPVRGAPGQVTDVDHAAPLISIEREVAAFVLALAFALAAFAALAVPLAEALAGIILTLAPAAFGNLALEAAALSLGFAVLPHEDEPLAELRIVEHLDGRLGGLTVRILHDGYAPGPPVTIHDHVYIDDLAGRGHVLSEIVRGHLPVEAADINAVLSHGRHPARSHGTPRGLETRECCVLTPDRRPEPKTT
mmetsp:Transcript_110522/g.317827  ORF Transcript_110522/g.317827 Transcript_110522/m.317827 type:complete len:272 (-) Transcript_110522:12-827(-)